MPRGEMCAPEGGAGPRRLGVYALIMFRYHPGVLRALRGHGFVPGPETDPERAYEWLKRLYVFEIRGLRARRREAERVMGPQPVGILRRQLAELKERYSVLAIPAWHWVERDGSREAEGAESRRSPESGRERARSDR